MPGSRFSLPSDKVEKIEPEKTEQEKRIEETVNNLPFSKLRVLHLSTSEDFPKGADVEGLQYLRKYVQKRYEEQASDLQKEADKVYLQKREEADKLFLQKKADKAIDTNIASRRVFQRMPTVNPRRVRVKPRVQPVE